MSNKSDRDIKNVHSTSGSVAKLRRLADSLEQGKKFEIQIEGDRIYVPVAAELNIEHEREGDSEEIELQIKCTNDWRPDSRLPHSSPDRKLPDTHQRNDNPGQRWGTDRDLLN